MRRNINYAALIIAGGRSTRFWPVGRIDRPKSLFSITERNSLIIDTISRLQPLVSVERIFVLVIKSQLLAFETELKNIISPHNLIVEPEARGTTVAIAYGLATIAARCGKETIVVVSPADHYVPQPAAFRTTIGKALRLAANARAIVVIGIKPTRPETGYGYLKIGAPFGLGFKVARFIEKPPLEGARRMSSSGQFLWNAGIFVMNTTVLLMELRECSPALAADVERFASMTPRQLMAAYTRFELASFDREVAEKSSRLIGIQAAFEWHDVGSWHGLWLAMRGKGSNVTSDRVVIDDIEGVLARGGQRLMVLMGVKDLVAIDTDDVILIASRSRSQEVPRVLEQLKKRGLQAYL